MTEEESRTQLLCSLATSQRLVIDFGPTVFQRQPSTDTEPPIGLHLSDALPPPNSTILEIKPLIQGHLGDMPGSKLNHYPVNLKSGFLVYH